MVSGVRHVVTQGVRPVGEADRFCEGRGDAIEWSAQARTLGFQLNRPSHSYRSEHYVRDAKWVIIPFRARSPIRDVVVIKVFSEDDLTEEASGRSHQGGSQHEGTK